MPRTPVVVTGGSGFLGGHVLSALAASDRPVLGLARSHAAATRVAELGATPLAGDLDNSSSVDEAFTLGASRGARELLNLASLGFGQAPAVVAAAEEAGLRRAVFVSTTAIFTTLPAPSVARRAEGERAVVESALDWTVLRPTMIYGTPADRNMIRLLRALRRWPVLPLPGGGNRLQQPVHVEDVTTAVLAALDRPATIGHAYEVAGPEALTLRELVDQAASALGRRPRVLPVPLGPAVALAHAYERIAPNPRLRAEQIERLAEDKAFDITAARRDLGFDPRPFAEGIASEADLLAGTTP